MSTETSNSVHIYGERSSTAIIVVVVVLSSFVMAINLFAVVSIARNCFISVCTFLLSVLSTIEMLSAFACAATTLYSYLETRNSFESNSILCNFYAWLFVAFRVMATLIVTLLGFDCLLLSRRPAFYVKSWTSFRCRWIVSLLVFVVASVLGSIPLVNSSYTTSPDGGRFHCLFSYTGFFAKFYVVFHLVQTVFVLVVLPAAISRDKRVDARLSVLLVGEMVGHRECTNILHVREGLKISRLILALAWLYHACSVVLPSLLVLRVFDVEYPAVVGLLGLQLPTYGAMFLPLLYGLMWKPYRRAFYTSLSCLCPKSRAVKSRSVRSMSNPAFCETRDFDVNSILHTRGMSHQYVAQQDIASISARPAPIELNASQLTMHPKPDSSQQKTDSLPRAKSFQDRHYYTPSKYQNIFEIIDALSSPHRHANDETSDLSFFENPSSRLDSSSSSGPSTSVKLNDVSLQVEPSRTEILRGVDFSSVSVSSWSSNEKVINKSRLEYERSSSFKNLYSQRLYRQQSDETLTPPGAIRFTDLRKTRPKPAPQNVDSGYQGHGNGERFIRYLANESYVNNYS